MDVMDVQFTEFSTAAAHGYNHHSLIAYHRPTGIKLEAEWHDGESNYFKEREQLIDKMQDLITDRQNS